MPIHIRFALDIGRMQALRRGFGVAIAFFDGNENACDREQNRAYRQNP